MSTFNKWIRIIHRWLAIPLIAAIISLIVLTAQQGPEFTSPGWLGALGIGSILSLALSGIYMFGLHYISKFRRVLRVKRPMLNAGQSTTEVIDDGKPHNHRGIDAANL